MGYTDLWRCKRCHTLPEIVMRGKTFGVKCNVCNTEETTVQADNLDEVVKLWNQKNDPGRVGLFARVSSLFRRIKNMGRSEEN